MSQLVKRYSLFFTVLVGFSLLFNSLSASAQTPPAFSVTDKLIFYDRKGGSVDVTHSYFSKMFATNLWPSSALRDEYLDSFKNSRDSFAWGVFIEFTSLPSGSLYSHVELRWLEKSCNVSLFWLNDHYRFLCDGNSHSWRSVSLQDGFVSYSKSSSFSLYPSSSKLFSFSGDYSIDPSIKWEIPSLPKPPDTNLGRHIPDWSDNCGLDIGCHLRNISTAVRSIFSFLLGIFDFSDNNSLLSVLKWLFIPKDTSVWDFSSLSDPFKNTFNSILSFIDTLKKVYNAFAPPISYYSSSAYCSTSPVGDAGNHDSASHRYLFKSKVFGADFNPDICSFERAIGGYGNMSSIRVFTSAFLLVISLMLWYSFMLKVTDGRL